MIPALKGIRTLRVSMAWLPATLVLAGGVCNVGASIDKGYKPANMSEEQYYKISAQEAERDLVHKKQVAQERYDRKMARNASVLKGMQSQMEARRDMILSQKTAAPQQTAVEQGVDFMGYALWTLVGAVAAFFAWQHFKNRAAGGSGGEQYQFLTPALAGAVAGGSAKLAGGAFETAPRKSTLSAVGEAGNSRQIAPAASTGVTQNCYSCSQPTAVRLLQRVTFCGDTFSMCPSCAKQHQSAWAVK